MDLVKSYTWCYTTSWRKYVITQYLTFTKTGFEDFEKACVDVADAISLLGAHSSKLIPPLKPASRSSASPKDDDSELDIKTSVAATATAKAATETTSHVLSATKRARNIDEDIVDDQSKSCPLSQTEDVLRMLRTSQEVGRNRASELC